MTTEKPRLTRPYRMRTPRERSVLIAAVFAMGIFIVSLAATLLSHG